MRAIVKNKKAKGIILQDTLEPEVDLEDVLIKVKKVGICGTDLHIYNWDTWSQERINPPVILGHEFVGEIVELGKNVKNLKIGQRVTAEGHFNCGFCKQCRNNQRHICRNIKLLGVDVDGCFADFVSVPYMNIWSINSDIPDEVATIFDPFGNAMHAVTAGDVFTKNVLITGAGTIGLFAILISRLQCAANIIVVEPCNYRKKIAEKLGADLILDPKDLKIKEKILDFTKGYGPDVFLEMSGDGVITNLGLNLISNGGHAILLGLSNKHTPIDISRSIVLKGVNVYGITGRKMFETWYQSEVFLQKHWKMLKQIITHNFSLENIEEAFSLLNEKKAIKVILNIN